MALTDKQRPLPPLELLETDAICFAASADLSKWARATFIADDAFLRNDDHRHLNQATIGALWTNVPNGRAGRSIIGQAERGLPPAGKWLRARIERQILDWFGDVPDFILTFDAHYAKPMRRRRVLRLGRA
ncbi:putative metallopeptidase [Mesorhizobium sp. ORM16]|uniref:putative metallopeptidase n=1 Tax=Mesorhizobium sp. ORM16 TaxID=3376989 RepID=UPI0038574FE2